MIFAWKRGRAYLDLQLGTGKDVRTRIIERPGRWMGGEELQRVLAEMRDIVSHSLRGLSLDYGVISGDPERLDNAVITILYDRATDRPIAFNALSLMEVAWRGRTVEVLHLGLVVVEPGRRTQGMSWVLYGLTCMLIFMRRLMRPLWISNVSQVPAIIGKVAESFARVFPSPDPDSRRSYDHLSIAREIMRSHRAVFGVGAEAGFDEMRFVITNAYTGGSDNLKKSFAEAQPYRDERYNAFCRRQLDYVRGDDFLQLGQFDLTVARNYLLRSVPRDSLPALLYKTAFVFFGALLLPALRWFSTGQAAGDLRPWRDRA